MRSSRLEKATQRQYAKIQSDIALDSEAKGRTASDEFPFHPPIDLVQEALTQVGISVEEFKDSSARALAGIYQQRTGQKLSYHGQDDTAVQREILLRSGLQELITSQYLGCPTLLIDAAFPLGTPQELPVPYNPETMLYANINHRILSDEETRALLEMAKDPDPKRSDRAKQARKELIGHSLRFILQCAIAHKSDERSLEDRFQDGVVGADKAVTKFNLNETVKYLTYAEYWIDQHISRAILMNRKAIRTPVNAYEDAEAVHEAQDHLRRRDRMPSNDEVARYLKWPIKKVQGVLAGTMLHQSIDSPIKNKDDNSFKIDPGDPSQDTEGTALRRMSHKQVRQAFDTLPPRSQYILRKRLGMDEEAMSTRALAEEMKKKKSISANRINQIEHNSIDALARESRRNGIGLYYRGLL